MHGRVPCYFANFSAYAHTFIGYSSHILQNQPLYIHTEGCNMPKTNFCRGQQPMLSLALVKLGNNHHSTANGRGVIIDQHRPVE